MGSRYSGFVTRAQVVQMFEQYDANVIEPLRRQIGGQGTSSSSGRAVCGNGRVEGREQCDDGNRISRDGCSRICRFDQNRSSSSSSRSSKSSSRSSVNFCDGHRVGETYPSPDGCNTCTCTVYGSACTRRACVPDPQEDTCYSSQDCGARQVCSTQYGDCRSSCLPGRPCVQVCSGVCMADTNECRPYICRDGSVHPSCTADGHPINYFADPCMGDYQSSSRSSSSRSSSRSSQTAFSCNEKKDELEDIYHEYSYCDEDSDCTVFSQSCPYVTCGEAIHRDGLSLARRTAQEQLDACRREGQPETCAGCTQQRAVCVSGQCRLRSA